MIDQLQKLLAKILYISESPLFIEKNAVAKVTTQA
jgi:hypothetical protein